MNLPQRTVGLCVTISIYIYSYIYIHTYIHKDNEQLSDINWESSFSLSHVLGDTCHKRPCAYVNFLDHVTCTHLLAFMLHVTQQVVLGWDGVFSSFLEHAHMNTSSLLRNMMVLALEHISVLRNMMVLALEHISVLRNMTVLALEHGMNCFGT